MQTRYDLSRDCQVTWACGAILAAKPISILTFHYRCVNFNLEYYRVAMIYRQVLVLNQNYEPLSICSVKRAVVMMFLDKAELIETLDGQKLRSQAMEIPVPSVIRLDYYIKVPDKRIMLTRKNVIKRDGGRCQYCGQKKTQMTVDHVIPKRYGGA